MVWDWILKGIGRLLLGLKIAAAGIIGRILATFGLTMVSFGAVLPSLKAFVIEKSGGLPPEMMSFLGYLNVGVAMSMIFSALTVRLAWKVLIVPTAAVDAFQGGQS